MNMKKGGTKPFLFVSVVLSTSRHFRYAGQLTLFQTNLKLSYLCHFAQFLQCDKNAATTFLCLRNATLKS